MQYSYEKLNEKIVVCVSDVHRFGTDAFLLADYAKPRHKDTVVDLCTGCGIVPMVLAKRFEPSKIYAVEIQQDAYLQCCNSIDKSETKTSIIPLHINLKDINNNDIPNGSIDVVTCNPPYKLNDTGIKNQIDQQTIARHEVECTIDDVCKISSKMLRFGGKLVLCQRPERLCDVITAMKNNGIEPKSIRFVSKQSDTAPWLFLIEGKKGAKPFLKIEQHFYMYDENNEYTQQLKDIYANQHN